MTPQPEYELRLTPVAGNHNAPDVRRLARFLKAMLRSYGLRCTSAREVTSDLPNGKEKDR